MLRWIVWLVSFTSVVAHAELVVSDATVRLLPPSLPNTSAYFSIENRSQQTEVIIGASAAIADKAEVHNHLMVNDMMRMERQSEVEIAPGQTVIFKPGGLHLMLFGLKQPLQEGQNVDLSIEIQGSEPIKFEAKVVRPSPQHHH
jgi:copper(I)-binding protein